MIIDVHAHIGHWDNQNISPSLIVEFMEKWGVDLALISNLDGIHVDNNLTEVNKQTLWAVNTFPDKLRGLVWVNPWLQQESIQNMQAFLKNKKFVGIKLHPFYNRFYFNNIEVLPLINIAKEFDAPILIHTAFDEYSHPDFVAAVAMKEEFKNVKFILYHAGLNPPDIEKSMHTLKLVATHPNLYVDISWVEQERLERLFQIIPIEQILFGTDLPLGGNEHYRTYFQNINSLTLNSSQWSQFTEINSRNIFKL